MPCTVEASTAHGELFLRASVLHSNTDWIYESYDTASIYFCSSSPNLPSPELLLQTYQLPPASRCALNSPWVVSTPLGFQLKGFVSKGGPLTFLRSKPINFKSRSVLLYLLLIHRQALCRCYLLNGRRLHSRYTSPSLIWHYNHLLRTLVISPCMHMTYKSKSFNSFEDVFTNSYCGRFECVFGRLMPIYHSSTILSSYFKAPTSTKSSKIWILLNQEEAVHLKRDLDTQLCSLLQSTPDYKPIVTQIPTASLPWVVLLVPARLSVLDSSSTSPSLLTVITWSSIDRFVEVCSTNRDLTCANKLSSFCLTALMEFSSIFFNYLCLALGNAFPCCVLNFGILESFATFVLGFL